MEMSLTQSACPTARRSNFITAPTQTQPATTIHTGYSVRLIIQLAHGLGTRINPVITLANQSSTTPRAIHLSRVADHCTMPARQNINRPSLRPAQ